MIKLHTWEWLIDHCQAKDVDTLKAKGFGGATVIPYSYIGYDKTSHVQGVKLWRNIIAFNRGREVRTMEYSRKVAQAIGLE